MHAFKCQFVTHLKTDYGRSDLTAATRVGMVSCKLCSNKSKAIFALTRCTVFNLKPEKSTRWSALKMHAWKIAKLVFSSSAFDVCDYRQVAQKLRCSQNWKQTTQSAHSPKRVKQLYFSFAISSFVSLFLSISFHFYFDLTRNHWISISNAI